MRSLSLRVKYIAFSSSQMQSGMEKIPNPDLMDFNPDNHPVDTLKTRNTRLGQLAGMNPVQTAREYTGPYAETPQAKNI